jgi:branched-chain amino acid transport system substrate-binding protein
MHMKSIALAAALAGATLSAALAPSAANAQAKEQFFPLLVYRTGPYAPNGTPWANGKQDYIKLVNARDGGVNGVKIAYEECETGYATDKGVECYERLKSKGATIVDPQATGITFALTDKVANDHIPLVTMDGGRHPDPAPGQEGRRARQAQGQEDRPGLPR